MSWPVKLPGEINWDWPTMKMVSVPQEPMHGYRCSRMDVIRAPVIRLYARFRKNDFYLHLSIGRVNVYWNDRWSREHNLVKFQPWPKVPGEQNRQVVWSMDLWFVNVVHWQPDPGLPPIPGWTGFFA